MESIYDSDRKVRRLRALGVVLALAALGPASAHAASLTVPHQATNSLTVPLAPAPSPSTAPSAPPSPPSSSTLEMTGGNGFAPSLATYPAKPSSGLDVGHHAGEQSQENESGEGAPEQKDADTRIQEDLQSLYSIEENFQNAINGLEAGFAPNDAMSIKLFIQTPGALAWKIFKETQVLNSIYEDEQRLHPELATRQITGYSGVSDQACGADSVQTDAEVEDPNNGVSLC